MSWMGRTLLLAPFVLVASLLVATASDGLVTPVEAGVGYLLALVSGGLAGSTAVLRRRLRQGAHGHGEEVLYAEAPDCNCGREHAAYEKAAAAVLPNGAVLVTHHGNVGCDWAARLPDPSNLDAAVRLHMEYECPLRQTAR